MCRYHLDVVLSGKGLATSLNVKDVTYFARMTLWGETEAGRAG